MKTIRRFLIPFVLTMVIFPTTGVLHGQEETPRMKCLQKCQTAHNACLATAKDDANKKSACNKAVSDCVKQCPAPSGTD